MTFRIAATIVVTAVLLFAGARQALRAEEAPAGDEPAAKQQLAGLPRQEPVEYRRHIKAAMQDHLAAFGQILRFRVPHEDHFELHADALVALTAVHASLYPEGSVSAGTSPLVWEQYEAFLAASGKTAEAAVRLRESLETRNRHAILRHFIDLGESCARCHEAFREEQ